MFGTELINTDFVTDITRFVMRTNLTNRHALSDMSIGRAVCTLNIASPFGFKELFQFPNALVQSDDLLVLLVEEIDQADVVSQDRVSVGVYLGYLKVLVTRLLMSG